MTPATYLGTHTGDHLRLRGLQPRTCTAIFGTRILYLVPVRPKPSLPSVPRIGNPRLHILLLVRPRRSFNQLESGVCDSTGAANCVAQPLACPLRKERWSLSQPLDQVPSTNTAASKPLYCMARQEHSSPPAKAQRLGPTQLVLRR